MTRITSPRLIDELGGVDIAFGGIGINGHLAFNEAQDELTPEEFAALHTRVLDDHAARRATANAIGDLSGAIDAMPKKAVTIGMKRRFWRAKKIRLGVFRDWHRARGAPGGLRRGERALPGDADSAATRTR